MGAGIDRYLKASRKRAATRLPDGTTVIATSTVHGPNQMRCMRCHGMCRATKNAQGADVFRCSTCGTESVGRKF